MTTPNSTNAAMFWRGLFLPSTQAVFQILSHSINNTASTTGMTLGWRDFMPLAWNGWTIHATDGVTEIGRTSGTVGGIVASKTLRGPSQTDPTSGASVFSDGSSAISPVYVADIVFNAGDMGTSKYSNSLIVETNQKWLRTLNYFRQGSGYPLSHRWLFFENTSIAPSFNIIAGRTTGANQVIYTKPGTPSNTITYRDVGTTWVSVDGASSGSSGGGSPGTGDPNTDTRGNSGTAVLNTADKHYHLGSRYRVGNTCGVHWNQPISYGAWRTVDHLNTAFFTNTALTQWFNATDWPTHILIWLGQNQDPTENSQLGTGVGTQYKANLQSIMDRYDAVYVAAGQTLPKYCFITQYRTGYNQVVYDTMATAEYELAVAAPTRVAHINLYQLTGGHTVDQRGTYLSDGVHPNSAGKQFYTQHIYREAVNSLTSTAFRHLDTFHFPWSVGNQPDRRYRIVDTSDAPVSTVVSVSGGVMVFTSAAGSTTTTCLRHDNGPDHVWGDTYTQAKITQKTAVNTTHWFLFARYTGASSCYSVDFNLITNAYTVRMGSTTIASGTQAIAVNDIARIEVTGTGSSTSVVVKLNGTAFSTTSVSAANGLPAAGLGGVGFTSSLAGTLQIDDLDIGPLGSSAPSTSNYVGRAPATNNLGKLGIYLETQDSGETDAQGKVSDNLWKPSGFTADWYGFISANVDSILTAYPTVRRLCIRGVGGHNFGVGIRQGLSYTTTAAPSAAQSLAQICGLRINDLYRNTTDSGFTSVPSDGRLLDGFKAAIYRYLTMLDEIVLYGCAFPSGTKVTGSAGGTPTAYTNSSPAFDEWDWEALDAGAVSSVLGGAGVSNGIDTAFSDPGGTAGATPAENTALKAYYDRLIATRTHRVYLEPPPDLYNQGGTSANLTYYQNSRFNVIGVTDPVRANDTVARGIDQPTAYFGKASYVAGQEAVAWVTGAWTDKNARRDAAIYYLNRGFTVFLEFGGMSASQIAPVIAAAAGAGGARTGRTSRTNRISR